VPGKMLRQAAGNVFVKQDAHLESGPHALVPARLLRAAG